MGTPHEKQHIRPRDWVVTCMVWCALLIVTLLNWRLANFVERKQEEIRKHSTGSGAPASPHFSPKPTRGFPTKLYSAPIRFLFKRDVLNVVNVTAMFIWLMLVLDCISWTYIVTFEVWDWFVIIVDGFCVAFGALSAVLMLVVFMQRAYSTFDWTPYQYSARMYNVMGTLILLVAICALLMGAFTGGMQWKLVSLSAIVFVVFYSLTCSLLIWMLFSPLRKLAFELRNEEVLHVAVRITFLSVLSLVSTSVTYLISAVAYNKCDECILTYWYYSIGIFDAVLNVLCLTWSLKHGQEEYLKVCGCVHSRLFKQLKSKENIESQDAEADDGL